MGVASAALLICTKKRDWLVEPYCFTFGLTFMIASMRNAALVLQSQLRDQAEDRNEVSDGSKTCKMHVQMPSLHQR